jgi:predicted metal-dependent enzyme (double-stranded beta helix superfamily)
MARISSLTHLLTASANAINSMKLYCPVNYNINRLKNIKSIMYDYYSNNCVDWHKCVDVNKLNDNGYHKYTLYPEFKELDTKIVCSVITWAPGAETDIHSHKNMSCLMMPLNGTLNQDIITSNIDGALLAGGSEFDIYKRDILLPGSMSYIDDDKGKHRIMNDSSDYVVSVHLYEDHSYTKN